MVLNCFHLLWIIFIYTWLVLPPYNCSYFQVIYFQVTYFIFNTILLCLHLFPSAMCPLPPLWKKHPFPSLLVNYDDGSNDAKRSPNWLSQMFEYGFTRLIKLISHDQTNQLPQIIQTAIKKIWKSFCFD